VEIRVIREQFTPRCTIGRLLIDDHFECYTLEDGIRTNKVAGETAIPVGRYAVTVSHSPRFKCRLPLLADVPNFTGVRIHAGNTSADTAGCILVGRTRSESAQRIGASRIAFEALLPKIEAALRAGEAVALTIEQVNAPLELAIRTVGRKGKGPPRKPAGPKAAVQKRGARARRRPGPAVKKIKRSKTR
jgi:hypothetical protein